eukprot:2484001-Rhodomonas_salina.1
MSRLIIKRRFLATFVPADQPAGYSGTATTGGTERDTLVLVNYGGSRNTLVPDLAAATGTTIGMGDYIVHIYPDKCSFTPTQTTTYRVGSRVIAGQAVIRLGVDFEFRPFLNPNFGFLRVK